MRASKTGLVGRDEARSRFGKRVKLMHAMRRASANAEAEATKRARNAYRAAAGLPPVK